MFEKNIYVLDICQIHLTKAISTNSKYVLRQNKIENAFLLVKDS